MLIIRPRRWGEKPEVCVPRFGDPLAERLIACIAFDRLDGGNRPAAINKVSGQPWTYAGGAGLTTSAYGLAGDFDGSGKRLTGPVGELQLQRPTKAVSIFWYGISSGNVSDSYTTYGGVMVNGGGSEPYVAYEIGCNVFGNITPKWNYGGTRHEAASSKYSTDVSDAGVPWGMLWRLRMNSGIADWSRHELLAIGNKGKQVLTSGLIADAADINYPGNVNAYISYTGRDLKSKILALYMWESFLPDGAAESLMVAPYQFLEAGRARVWTFGAAPGSGAQTLSGGAGIASSATMGSGGVVNGGDLEIEGSAGIPSNVTFGSSGAIVAGYLGGSAGIPSSVAFGAGGTLAGPITGVAGIHAGVFGDGGVVAGPITGAAGIPSNAAFGDGIVAGPLTGAAGIPSSAAMGAGGELLQPIVGVTGIDTSVAFGSAGAIISNDITGYLGITSSVRFGRGGALIGGDGVQMFIAGIDRTRYLRRDTGTFSVASDMSARSTASATLYNPPGWRYRPNPGDEIKYYFDGALRFAGFVVEVEETPEFSVARGGSRAFEQVIRCTDYTDILERRVVAKVWPGPTLNLQTIVGKIVASCLNGEGITYEPGEDLTLYSQGKLVFAGETVLDAFTRIGEVFGFDFRLDFTRTLRFQRNYASVAPRALRDGDGQWDSIRVKRSRRQKRNRQGVQTSIPASGQRSVTFTATGSTWMFDVADQVTGKPTITLDAVAQVVVLNTPAGKAAGPWDFAYEINSSLIYANLANAAPSGALVITFSSRNALDIVWYEDSGDIVRTAAREGNSGVYESVRRARNVIDLATATRAARAGVETSGAVPLEITIESRVPGWEVGQLVSIWTSNPPIAGTFLVRSVSFSEVDGEWLAYTITAAGVEPPLIVGIAYNIDGDLVITTDRPHGLGEGEDLNLYGLNYPWNSIEGTYEGGPGTTGTEFIIPFEQLPATTPPEGTEFTGGLGGTTGGGSLGGRPGIWKLHYEGQDLVLECTDAHGLQAGVTYQIVGVISPYHMLDGVYVAADATHTKTAGVLIVILEADVPATTPGFGANPAQAFRPSGYVSPADLAIADVRKVGDDLVIETSEAHYQQEGDIIRVFGVLDPFAMVRGDFTAAAGTGGTDIYIDAASVPAGTPGFGSNPPDTFVVSGWVHQVPPDSEPGYVSPGAGYGGGVTETGEGSPYGGYAFSGLTPSYGNGEGSNIGEAALIPIAVEIGVDRVPEWTTNRDHGLSGSDEVSIMGVTGGYPLAGEGINGFNTERTRVQITADNKFKAIDKVVPTSIEAFVDDRRGRVVQVEAIPRPAPANTERNVYLYLRSVGQPDNSQPSEKATFVLANSIPGFASAPLRVMSAATNDWIAQRDVAVIESVSGSFRNPAVGSDILIDVKKNGVSIFEDGTYLRVPEGSTDTARVESGFRENPMVVSRDDRLSVDIVQVGSDFAGCNGSVVCSMR